MKQRIPSGVRGVGRVISAGGAAWLRAIERAWWWLRQVSDDAAYENYLRRLGAASSPGAAQCSRTHALSAGDFLVERLNRKYAGVSRCC